nr:nuclease-related domain-containing protein [uncultured Dongia sp.]
MTTGIDCESEPRNIDNIFSDLRVLAQTKGALHGVSSIIFRDWVLTIDTQERRIVDDPTRRWSQTKLNKNELMLLLGLIVQSSSEEIFSVIPEGDDFVRAADRLLQEFHERLAADFTRQPLIPHEALESGDSFGAFAREAIYYGAESFYLHQLENFARYRYRHDGDWLLQNVGISILPMLQIARFIVDRTNNQISAARHSEKAGQFNLGQLTNSLLVSKRELTRKFGEKANAFIKQFSSPILNSNSDFTHAFAINQVSLKPLIDLGDYLYVSGQFRLFESIYESPFYWMMADEKYCNTEAEHRGQFLETTTAHLLRSVFGTDNVFQNVIVKSSKKKTGGEADVLVVYGEFVIVVQAKSKRVTLKARAGDIEALKADFENAIQTPYRQAQQFSELLLSGATCTTADGRVLTLPRIIRAFPAVVLSDSFPSTTILSSHMLTRDNLAAPVIWDIGILDCVTKILSSPIDLIFYLKCRSEAFEDILSDSEYNLLGYHLKHKLARGAEADFMMIGQDFAEEVDDFMFSLDMKLKATPPIGILQRIQIPVVSLLLDSLRKAPPSLAAVAIDLYDFSSSALENMSLQILNLREEVVQGKKFKSFSLPTQNGGFTYLVCQGIDEKVIAAGHALGTKYKYESRRDRWYVIIDDIETQLPIDRLLPILGKWEENEEMGEHSRRVGEMFGSKRREIGPPEFPNEQK